MRPLHGAWRTAWPLALADWSEYTRLCEPVYCKTRVEAAGEGLTDSFAMIRFRDQRIVIFPQSARQMGLRGYEREILSHEIGHHVYIPGNASDHLRMIARIRSALPALEMRTAEVANMYADLLVNDRLQRQHGLRMANIFKIIHRHTKKRYQHRKPSAWDLYMRIYEQLWELPAGSIHSCSGNPGFETDAWLGARLVRVYAREWLTGAGRFAALLLPYLANDEETLRQRNHALEDMRSAAQGCSTSGIIADDCDEQAGIHPAEDPLITGVNPEQDDKNGGKTSASDPSLKHGNTSSGQYREPCEFNEILQAAGITLEPHEAAIRYYRERAIPYLLPFPVHKSPHNPDPVPEGLDPWDAGDSFDAIDYLSSLSVSPVLIPGVTTLQRVYGSDLSSPPVTQPVDLDIYVDSSGSMNNPQRETSWLTLAGAIIALSALRSGSSVQVTLWSGKEDVLRTDGFIRDEHDILAVLTGYFGGWTNFPVHCLRETYLTGTPVRRPVHILMISDDGITSLFDAKTKNGSGFDIAGKALEAAKGGGTMVLNLDDDFFTDSPLSEEAQLLKKASAEQGWALYSIDEWEQLLDFARDFTRRHRAGAIGSAGTTSGAGATSGTATTSGAGSTRRWR